MKDLNEDEVFIAKISAEEDAIMLHNTEMRLARNEGKEEGKIETAKALIADKLPLEKIQSYTGLSLKEIKNLM